MIAGNMTYCELCRNEDLERFKVLYNKRNYSVVECEICGFVFIPQKFRDQIPYESYRDEAVLNEVRKGNNWLKYRRHKLRVNFIKKYIKKGKLFDAGTGWGHFLHTAKRCGYETNGIEISKLMHLYATQDLELNVINGDFFKEPLPKNHFDIVTMWDVLEHLDYPVEAVKRSNEILKSGGYLVVQVPQFDSFIAKRKKDKWSMMSIEHVNYFTIKTIKKVLNDNGFEVIKIKSSFEFKLFIMFSLLPLLERFRKRKVDDGSVKNNKISNTERQSFFNKLTKIPHFALVIIMFFHDMLYKLLSALKIGEEMMVIAKKQN